jgi:uncharacterized protein (DUF302 family)
MIDDFTVRHLEYVSTRSFDDVVQRFEEATGDSEDGAFTRELARSRDLPDFEKRMHAREGTSGFMRFLVLDHGAWLKLYDVKTRSRLYTLGNPLIAKTMLSHDLGAALNVPVRLFIYETENEEVRLGYDLPSSLMSRLNNAEVTAAAEKLDAKLAALAERATGAKA